MSTSTSNNTQTEQPFSVRSIILPLLAVVFGMIMVILDSTVVNVAISGLVETFGSDFSTMQWTVTSYTLALSAVIPLAGWMNDRFGAKRVFLISIVFFTLGSLLCSFATTPLQLIIYRIVQGLGGGMVAPIGMAMVFRLAPANKIGSVMAVLGVPMMLGPALGPVLSGWIMEYSTWHWLFLINIPIGIIAVIIGIKYLPSFQRQTVPALDKIGFVLAPIAFAALAYAVNEGGTSWTSTQTIVALIVGTVALILFIIAELQKKEPLLELRVFKSSDFNRGIILSWLMQIALFGSFIIIPYYLQQMKGYSPFETGLMLLPQALASGMFMPIGGKLFDKLGARPVVIVGLSMITAGLFMFSLVKADTGMGYIIPTLMLMGGGMGMSMMPLNTHVLQAAPRKLVSRVTSLTSAAQQVMVSFAVAGLTGFLTSRLNHHGSASGGNMLVASEQAFQDVFLLAAAISFIGVLGSLLLRKPKKSAEEQTEDDKEAANSTMMMGH